MEIRDSHFLITGSNRGIGNAIAKVAAREKCNLYLANRTIDSALETQLKELGALNVLQFKVDLSSRKELAKFSEQIIQYPISILLNNSGTLVGGLLENQSTTEIDNLLEVNLRAVIVLTKAILPGMISRKKGLIINNSSVSAIMPFQGASTYAATKAAVLSFTRCLQNELGGTGVSTLSLVTPGVETRMFNEIPTKFGSFLNVKNLSAISAEDYAERVRTAILENQTELHPRGITRIAEQLAIIAPKLYNTLTGLQFNRHGADSKT